MDPSDPRHPGFGPGGDFNSLDRRKIITKILKYVRLAEESERLVFGIEIQSWFLLWLGDMPSLRSWEQKFENDPVDAAGELNARVQNTFIPEIWLATKKDGKENSSTNTSRVSSTQSTPVPLSSTDQSIAFSSDISGTPRQPSSPAPMDLAGRRKRPRLSGETTPKRQKVGSPSPSPAPTGSASKVQRGGEDLKKQCRYRDLRRCVLTKATEPIEVCHVVPHSFVNLGGIQKFSFWHALRGFWSNEKVERWKALSATTECISNWLCLTPSVHKYWGKGLWAIRPLSNHGTSMQVQFFWLRPGQLPQRIMTGDVLPQVIDDNYLVSPPILPGDLRKGGVKFDDRLSGPNLCLFDCEEENMICSGQVITLTTPDATEWPLPSFELLELQWHLQRLCALCAAAEPTDYDDDEDDDECCAETVPAFDEVDTQYHQYQDHHGVWQSCEA